MSWLAVREIEAGYGKRQVLFGASVALEKQEIALLVGPNGSGKSTLLRSIFRQCDFFAAKEFCYHNHDLQKTPLLTLMKAGLAYTPQHRNIFDRLTVGENLTLAITVRNGHSVGNRFQEILKNVPELVPMLRKAAGQLSGGQRKLLALAMGLSVLPELLLLDEPLAGLDERSIERVVAIVRHYRQQYGVAFLIVEHRFTKLTGLADKCYGMKLGKTIVGLNASQLRDSAEFDAAMQQVFFL